MHVLILPSFYPERHRPNNGIFFKNQAEALVNYIEKIGLIYVEQKSLKKVFSLFFSSLYQKSIRTESGVLVYRVNGLSFFNQYELGNKIWMWTTEKLIQDYIKDNGKPDFIHVHNMLHAGRVALRIKEKIGIPYIITEHASSFLLDTYGSRQIQICKEIMDNSKSIIAVSSALAKAISEKCGEHKISIVPNVIDTSIFKADGKRPNSKFTFICVGNLIANKGHFFLIQSFAKAFSENNNVQLVICGDGPELERLKSLIAENQLAERIILKSAVSPKKLVELYQTSDCLVSPSYKETFGVVIIEAMACGLPVIATKSGGPEDIINEENGILVEAGSIEGMAKALNFIVENREMFDSSKIASFAKERFSPSVVAKEILSFYK